MKVLFPIDGSGCSCKTLQWAAGFLDKENTSVHLLYVLCLNPVIGCPVDGIALEPPGIEDEDPAYARDILDQGRELMEANGFRVASAEIVKEVGSPSATICDYADRHGMDQIVIGSHGRTGLAQFLMGSVSKGVFERAKQPVVLLNNGPTPTLQVNRPDQVHLAQ